MTKKWQTLTESLEELERTDPKVAAAAASFDQMRDDMIYRAELERFRPLPTDRMFSRPVDPDIPHCTCGGGKGFARDYSVGTDDDASTHLWVCMRCRKPTKPVLDAWLQRSGFYD